MSDFLALDEGVSEQQARELIRESARNGGQEFEFPMETADGETIWVVVFLHGIGNFCPIVVDSTVGLWRTGVSPSCSTDWSSSCIDSGQHAVRVRFVG